MPVKIPFFFRKISIHAPRVGSDPNLVLPLLVCDNFNPRSPCGERQALARGGSRYEISIHAPRVGSDSALPFRALGLI